MDSENPATGKVRLSDVYRPVYPTPAGLITSVDRNGAPYIITLGEVFNLSIRNPVIVGIAIAPPRYSHTLISETGEFVVNLPTAAMKDSVLGCGSCSGRDGVDKFARFGLTPLPAEIVAPPLIAECPVNLECRVLKIETIGDHDLFQGEVVAEHVSEDILNAKGDVDAGKLDPFVFMRGTFWSIGRQLQ